MRKKKQQPADVAVAEPEEEDEDKEYTFEELSAEAKETAIEEYRNSDPYDYEWWDCVYDEWVEKLDKIGFEGAKIWFSGFYSQGDGACFDADCDTEKLAKHLGYYKTFNAWYLTDILGDTDDKFDINDINIKISGTNHHYSHENCRDLEIVDWGSAVGDDRQGTCEDFEKECEQLRYDLSREIYKALEDEWDGMNTDEYISENIIANEYTFTKDGDRT